MLARVLDYNTELCSDGRMLLKDTYIHGVVDVNLVSPRNALPACDFGMTHASRL
jgi:hypothetical protein